MAAANPPDPGHGTPRDSGPAPSSPADPADRSPRQAKEPIKAASAARRISVSEILTSVAVSKDEQRSHRWHLAGVWAEGAAIMAIHMLLFVFLKVPAPVIPQRVETADSGVDQHVWLQVRPLCWAAPEWDSLVKGAQAVNATGKTKLTGEGDKRTIQLDNVVDDKTKKGMLAWAGAQRNACLIVEKGKEEYQLLVKATWSPTSQEQVDRAAAALPQAGVTLVSAQWLPTPLFALESTSFPARTMESQHVHKVLASAGLRNFAVETATDAAVDATMYQRWSKAALEPFKKAQRGAIALQMVVFAVLCAIWMLVLKGRFVREDEPEPLTFLESLTRGVIASVVAGLVVALLGKKIGIDFRLLQAQVRLPDAPSTVLAFVSFGLLWPALHGVVVHGYLQRRLGQEVPAPIAIGVAAVLLPLGQSLVVPLPSPQLFLWIPVGVLGGYLAWSTGRLGPALAVTTATQAAIVLLALF
ncbi:MAG: hypothetical protein FJ100_04170 [Deltaproteobacteria bacterium]|nr:hypothetical protein [Deltaproteobacteria bacterium]